MSDTLKWNPMVEVVEVKNSDSTALDTSSHKVLSAVTVLICVISKH